MFPTCRGNVVHTTASLPHFTVPTGARLCGVWGGLCSPLSSPGRLYLATFANLVADRTAVCLTQVFALPQCACGNHSTSLPHPTTRPWNIVRHKKHSTQLCSIPPNTKYITLPLKCAAFNPSNNSGQGKGKFQVHRLIQYSNFDTLSSLVQRLIFFDDFLHFLLLVTAALSQQQPFSKHSTFASNSPDDVHLS